MGFQALEEDLIQRIMIGCNRPLAVMRRAVTQQEAIRSIDPVRQRDQLNNDDCQ